MFRTLIVYVHLLATCIAIGTIVLTDLRLMAKVMGYRVVIPKPERLETTIITVALTLLYLTGAAIVFLGVEANPDYLENEKLLAKLLLVGLLTVNAVMLHKAVFPILGRSRPVSQWSRQEWFTVSTCVSLSNSVWLYCAFLGVARVWNNTVSLEHVLSVALAVWITLFLLVNTVLKLAARDAPKPQPDWIDFMKASLSDFSDLRSR
jgi:hypothetical protein